MSQLDHFLEDLKEVKSKYKWRSEFGRLRTCNSELCPLEAIRQVKYIQTAWTYAKLYDPEIVEQIILAADVKSFHLGQAEAANIRDQMLEILEVENA